MLRRYYSLNIPPVLWIEILADLKKFDNVAESQRKVQVLAEKLVPICSAINATFRSLIIAEFQGRKVRMTGSPFLAGGESVISQEGKLGVIFEEAPMDQALLRWQAGEFRVVEHSLAGAWRQSTLSVNLEELQRKLRSQYSRTINLQSLKSVAEFVDNLMISGNPHTLFSWFLNDIALMKNQQIEIMNRLIVLDAKAIILSFPYASFCMRTALIFHFALAFGLVTTRPTNRVDLEYLYYLPFCDALSSGDKFHRAITKYLLKEKQIFFKGDDLKADLKQLANWWDTLNEQEHKAELGRSGPPENEESITHQLWQKLMKPGYREQERLSQVLTPEQKKRLVDHVQELLKTPGPSSDSTEHSLDDIDFLVRKHSVRLNGPCLCGSNRTFANCCGSYLSGQSRKI